MPSEQKWLKFKKFFFQFKLDYFFIFLSLAIYYTFLQWNNYIGDSDGYYHAKMALFLREGILLKNLPWMQFSSITEHFTDHQLLYHLLLVPFTYIKTPLIGVKIATVLFAAMMGLTFYWLFKKLKITWPWLWTFLIISLADLNFRLALVKVNSWSWIFIAFIIYSLYYKKRWLTFFLSFFFVWLYGGWPIAGFIGFIFWLASKIYDYIHHKKIKLFRNRLIITWEDRNKFIAEQKMLIFLLGGLLAGVIFNPYFPHNLKFYYEQFFLIGVINYGHVFSVGAEWYRLSPMMVVSSGSHFFALGILALVILFFNYKKISHFTWLSFLLTFLFFFLTIKSRRYVEYYLPFLLLFNASAWTDIIKKIGFVRISKYIKSLVIWQKVYLYVCLSIFTIILLPNIYKKILETKIPSTQPIDKYQNSANWLKNNTEKQSIVMNANWDQWPMLFYYNDHNYYFIGLDFSFMYFYDPALQKKYIDIAKGDLKDNLAQEITENFRAQYIILEKTRHTKLNDNIKKDQGIFLVYEDQYFLIYQIIY
ncbi:MAG: hypothetical protein QG642_277 [Patescibacteria group bacterium]|nr:hypothetical protein [Patescibacteria group bacterium]